MAKSKLKELAAARAKVATLEKAVAAEQRKELAGLPAKYGFAGVAAFVQAVQADAGGRGARKAAKPSRRKRKARVAITDAMRAELKKLVDAGKTGGEIAKALNISMPSVHNVKKALGLIGKKKK